MAMHLDKIPFYKIMIIGFWSFYSFLFYFRKQVYQLIDKIARKMNSKNYLLNFP